jgi:hypothetical protein
MFDKIGRMAEAAANSISVSRRGFLGRLGQGALAAAGVLGGLLLFPRDALAGGSGVCRVYSCRKPGYLRYSGKSRCQPAGTTCAPFLNDCGLWQQFTVTDCAHCKSPF